MPLPSQHTKDVTPSQEPIRYLIGSGDDRRFAQTLCPAAQTLRGFSVTLGSSVIVQIRCKRWTCSHCGRRKMTHYAHRVAKARPNRFITLTTNPALWDSPQAAYDGTRSAVTKLAAKIRRRISEFEYFKVIESTRKGWPHYHLIVRSDFIPQPLLSQMWGHLTGAPIVDVRKVRKSEDTYWYTVKYLGKQKVVPWTTRRCSWTRNFFPPKKELNSLSLQLEDIRIEPFSPLSWIRWHIGHSEIEAVTRDCWIVKRKRKKAAAAEAPL